MEIKNNDNGNKKKILIIDDEVDLTFTFKVGLEDTGLFTVELKPVEIAELIKRINDIIAPNLPGHL